jgi:hypothetical protein
VYCAVPTGLHTKCVYTLQLIKFVTKLKRVGPSSIKRELCATSCNYILQKFASLRHRRETSQISELYPQATRRQQRSISEAIKVKLSLCLIKHDASETRSGGGTAPYIFTSVLNGHESSFQRSGRVIPWNGPPKHSLDRSLGISGVDLEGI